MLPVQTKDREKNGDVIVISPKIIFCVFFFFVFCFFVFFLSEMQASLTAVNVQFITLCHVLSQGQQGQPLNHAFVGFLPGHCSSGGTSNALFLSLSLVPLPFFML